MTDAKATADLGWVPQIVPAPFDQLTKRELQVVFYLAHGLYPSAAALILGCSTKTVDTHRGHALKKLGIANTVLLARFAIKTGFVTAHDPSEPCKCGRELEVDGLIGAWQQIVGGQKQRHD